MKINNIKALDYQVQGSGLVLILAETTLEDILNMDMALLQVNTDEDDLVEALAGYRLTKVTYDVASNTFTAMLEQGAADTTAAALAAVTAELAATKGQVAELQQANEQLSSQLGELTGAIERGLTQ